MSCETREKLIHLTMMELYGGGGGVESETASKVLQ
jgi:hypothetical protein